jgi:hypothetical protein
MKSKTNMQKENEKPITKNDNLLNISFIILFRLMNILVLFLVVSLLGLWFSNDFKPLFEIVISLFYITAFPFLLVSILKMKQIGKM